MADDTAELLVSIRADVQDLKDKFAEAQEVGNQASDSLMDSFGELGGLLAGIFAVDKIKDFAVSAVEEFTKVQRAFDILSVAVDNSGTSWDANKEKVDGLIDSEQRFSGLTKEQLVPALTQAEIKTGNLGASMKILDLATKMQMIGLGDLHQNVTALSQAFDGNTAGLARFSRRLKLTDADAKDSTKVIEAVVKATQNLDRVVNDTQGGFDRLGASWQDFKEDLAAIIDPIVKFGVAITTDVIDRLDNMVHGIHMIGVALEDFFTKRGAFIVSDWKKGMQEGVKIAGDTAKQIAVISDQEFEHEVQNNAKKTAKKKKEDEKEAKEELADAKELAEEISDAKIQIATMTFEILGDLGEAAGEKALAFDKAVNVAKAIMNTAVSITQANADYPYPYNLAIDALLGTEGAIEIAKIEGVALASGGIVTAPTRALIGEAGPEAVIPLNHGGLSMLGGDSPHFHFPGVNNRDEAQAAGQSAALSWIKTKNAAQVRSGARNR